MKISTDNCIKVYSICTCTCIGATLKICKKSNFDQNQLKISIQHKNMYMYQKKL